MNIQIFFLVYFYLTKILAEENYCSKAYGCPDSNTLRKGTRFILYDVNSGEGFNLKRDVYMRIAMFVRTLTEDSNKDWHLVLPPWNRQWHWTTEKHQVSYLWHNFFHVESMQLYAPVIEIEQFLVDYGESVDEVYILQHFPEFYEWSGDGGDMDWSDKWGYADCRDHPYWKQSDGTYIIFRGKNQVKAKQVKCISFQGSSSFLKSVVSSTKARSIMFDRAEVATHMMYGDVNYWMCRRSMRFAKHLVKASKMFRASHLNSSDELDGTVRPANWRDEHPHRSAKGGPYLGVHLRRQDFVHGRSKEVPSLTESALQIRKFLTQLNLTTVFIATDMAAQEYAHLSQNLQHFGLTCFKYDAVNSDQIQFKEGELAIIDQIIASHAKFFVGTHESTFSYRIQEEREIMGFPPETTFNRFCPSSDGKDCTPSTKWLIKYSDEEYQKFEGINYGHFKADEL